MSNSNTTGSTTGEPSADNNTHEMLDAYITVLTQQVGVPLFIDDLLVGETPLYKWPVKPGRNIRIVAEIEGVRVSETARLLPGEAREVYLERKQIPESKTSTSTTSPTSRSLDIQESYGYGTDDNKRTERTAIEVYIREYELSQGRTIRSVTEEKRGYDVELFDDNHMLERYIEVKSSLGYIRAFMLTANEWARAKDLGNSYWLYLVEQVDPDVDNIDALEVAKHITVYRDPYTRFKDLIAPQTYRVVLSREAVPTDANI